MDTRAELKKFPRYLDAHLARNVVDHPDNPCCRDPGDRRNPGREINVDPYIAAVMRSRKMLTFAGLTALHMLGFPELRHMAGTRYPIQVCVSDPSTRSKLTGVDFLCWPLPYEASVYELGERTIRIVDPITACLQSLRFLDHIESVVMFDSLLSRHRSNRAPKLAMLETLILGPQRFKGKTTGKWALRRTRGGTDSPMESRVRIKLQQSRFPEPVINHPILHPITGERWFADMAYPRLRVAIEYQGIEFHATRAGLERDSRKISGLQGLSWNVIPLTATDVFSRRGWERFTDTLRAVIRAQSKRVCKF